MVFKEAFPRVGVAMGVKTDRNLPERIQRIEDPAERMRAIEKHYKRENVRLGAACVDAAVNTTLIATPAAPLAAPRAVWSALQVRAAVNNRETIEHLALQQGVNIHEGPRRRYVAEGAVRGAFGL